MIQLVSINMIQLVSFFLSQSRIESLTKITFLMREWLKIVNV